VFEDLHWADAESLALFGRLAVTADLPLLLVGTFRPEGVARRHPLVELLAELERQRLVTGVALERLSRAGVAELLAAVYGNPVPYQVAEALHRRTGGNPFFLEELVVTAGRVDPARLATLPLPWNLSEAVLRRLDDLAPSQRRVVDAAAILGRRISFDLLAAVTGSGEDELIAILHHLVAENVMEEEPDLFAFRHALTREAIGGRPSPGTPRGPAATRRWSRPPAPAPGATSSRAPPPRRCAWPRPACPRPTTTRTCWPPPPRRPG
jgi:predicted ATPase